ncbi:hypothetical protein BJ508DRAFT_410594 [Ascobolus immersus RN42]|uniref:Protein transport protein SEC31 n=1 Tax=Ascobolus immersus RN42 TaxID=1160509 RepID=A0A3N4INJ9_ASCIM|nr:hypothetical protein BJ508DRAFT_410594 [Ascobolus immersus RN42]
MVRLREVPRTSTLAWSPGAHSPLLATGTVAGAVDADFSNTTQLELWDLELGSPIGTELTPKATANTDSRFYDIAWGGISNDRPKGIIAGGMESGSLNLWSADTLLDGSGDPLISSTTKHSGAIKSLQFNPFKSELLLTAGAKGEIFVWDMNNVENPFQLGNRAARADDFESADWNKLIPHILVTGGSGGFVTVWDVKSKKESLTLNTLGRKAVSAVAWHPDNSTKLVTAIPDDSTPVVHVWDLRNANAPEKTLTGHELGVLSVSWCKQDSDLLLTSGKDNRTICWNPNTGVKLGEFPIVANWTFQTRWNPRNPTYFATASFDGKITVQSIQSTNSSTAKATPAANTGLDGEDFFAQASFEPQGQSFSLPQAPKWLKRPAAVAFGFGGKLVTLGTEEANGKKVSKVKVFKYAVESSVNTATEAFEKAISEGKLRELCQSRASEAKTDAEREEWESLAILFEKDPKKKYIKHLGFKEGDFTPLTSPTASRVDELKVNSLSNGDSAKHKRLSSFFTDATPDSEHFLADLASIPSTRGARTNNPFQIFQGDETESDKDITRAVTLGEFDKAVDICLSEDRMSDAFMLAISGGQKCIEKVQEAYFKKKAKGPSYLRLLACIAGKNMWDIVHNADLKDWKEIFATISTYSNAEDFSDLCEVLGDRLEEEFAANRDDIELRRGAILAFIAGAKLEKAVTIWIEDLHQSEKENAEQSTTSSSFSIHAKSLQGFIEKVTVFREATKYVDKELTQKSDWKLDALYEKYVEYADVVAADGNLEVAEKYLNFLPADYPAAASARNRVKEANKKGPTAAAVKKTLPATQARQPQRPAYVPPQPTVAQPTQTAAYQQQQQAANPYAPKAPVSNPFGPSAPTANTPPIYGQPAPARSTYAPPTQSSYGNQPGSYATQTGGYQSQYNAPPQRSGPPPAVGQSYQNKTKDLASWNDTPMVTKPAPARKSTPAATNPMGGGAITTPFPGAQPLASPVQGGPPSPYGIPQKAAPPPPPKGAMPPQRVASPATNTGYAPPAAGSYGAPPQQRYPSVPQASTPYAPPPPPPAVYGQPPVAAPNYAAPPPAAKPSGRYTPAPSTTPGPRPGSVGPGNFAPPPQGPPPNQYGVPPPAPPARTGYTPNPGAGPNVYGAPPPPKQYGAPPQGPPQQYGAPPQGPPQQYGAPPQGPPQQYGAPPQAAQTQEQNQAEQPVAEPAQPPPPARHPKGDRSHIPAQYVPIYEQLNAEVERVKGGAPPSYKRKVDDMVKRLNILFDHINNEELLTEGTLASMLELSQAVANRDYDTAYNIHLELLTNKTDECSQWMIGVKRLIEMSRITP